MQMNAGLILAGQSPDIVGQMQRGMQMRQFETDAAHQNAFRAMLQEQGAGIMGGDQNALAALAQFDPQAALGVQQTRQGMAESAEYLQMARAQAARQAQTWAREQDAATLERTRADLDRALAMGTQVQTPEQWDAVVGQIAPDLVGQFDNRHVLMAGALGLRDALEMAQGPQQPSASDRYRVMGGQLVDLTAEGGPRVVLEAPGQTETIFGPDGQPIVQRGPARAFTEGQSRDVVYSVRARGALEAFEPVADALTSRPEIMAEGVPLGLARGFQSPEFQQAMTAGTEFLQAILRKDTGAAITTQEREEYGRVYLPQPGDSPEVLQMRAQARRRALAALESGMSQSQIAAQTAALGQEIARASGGAAPTVDSAPRNQGATPPSAQTGPRQQEAQTGVPDAAVRMLLDDPSPEAVREFDEIFGAGAAQRILGAIR